MVLKPYEFKPEDLEAFVHQYDQVDPVQDIKAAKKARTALKKKINEIKKIHTGNKKVVLQFKRDVEAYDKQKFELLTADLTKAFNRIDQAIEKVETGAALRAQEVQKKINDLQNGLMNEILNACTLDSIQEVQVKINSIKAEKSEYDDRIGEVETIKTSLLLKAAGRENEIHNAGGTIVNDKVVPMNIQPEGGSIDNSEGPSDTDLLNFLQSSAAHKGWTCNISPNTGVQLYQVDDPSAPKSVREAIRIAMESHQSV